MDSNQQGGGEARLRSEFDDGTPVRVARGAVGAVAQEETDTLGVVCASSDVKRWQRARPCVVGLGAHAE
jgi:hypothetical protein